LRAKITFILSMVLAVYLLIHFAVQTLVISPTFTKLEEDEAIKNMGRCTSALDREVQGLERMVTDWSAWDDSYRFVDDLNEEFIKANLSSQTFQQNNINLMAFLNNQGDVVWMNYFDLDTREPLSSRWFPHDTPWPSDHPLLNKRGIHESVTGILADGDRVMLVVSRFILTSQQNGPSNGVLVIGTVLSHEMLERISTQTQVRLHIWSLDGPKDADQEQILAELSNERPYVIRSLNKNALHVFTLYKDLSGKPAALMRAEVPREITAEARNVSSIALISAVVSGMLLLVILFIAMRKTVVIPLLDFSRQVASAKVAPAPEDPMLQRKDELGALARSFASLMNELSEEKKMLAQRSYRSGKAEMAGSLLHNIRNGLHPIAAFVDLLLQDIREAPLDDLENAMRELEVESLDPTRRKQLQEYRDLSVAELIYLFRDAEDALNKILDQTKKVIKTTNTHQQDNIREEREDVVLADAFRDAKVQITKFTVDPLALTLHPSILNCPSIHVEPHALQHVLGNLLLFHPTEHPLTHEVSVCLSNGHQAADGLLSIEIVHRRVNLDSAALERLFQRGYTDGRMIPDQGLHWCANTVNSLGGRLRASQEFGGITFHLSLPIK